MDVMIAIGSNFFLNVTLPCMLWFLDKGKKGSEREDTVLFIDARQIYNQVDRAHRDFKPEQLEFLANIVRLYRGEEPETRAATKAMFAEKFPDGEYKDVPGLCAVMTSREIEAQDWSLNPGRYVGVREREKEDFDFYERLEGLNEDLECLNVEARGLEDRIAANVAGLIEGTSI